MKKKGVLFYTHARTFVMKDDEILREQFDIKQYHYKTHKNIFKFTLILLKQFQFLLFNIRKITILYCWFADYHSFLPILFAKIFNKQSILVIGGYDAVVIPSVRYGVFYKKNLRAWMAQIACKYAKKIIVTDASFIKGENNFCEEKGLKVGITHFVKKKINYKIIPNGCDPQLWYKKKSIKKIPTVLSVGYVDSITRFKIKGFDLLLEVAQQLPEVLFTLIGLTGKMIHYAKKRASKNVLLLEFIENTQLAYYYSKSKVYCQLSMTEAFPNTLCEAMLCECTPVVSNVNSMPYGIGKTGFIVMRRNIDQAKKCIQQALSTGPAYGYTARKQAIQRFSITQRKKLLLSFIKANTH